MTMEIEDRVRAKRELGNGRWDRKLRENMVTLSVADNYDDAKHEWIATGEVWWNGLGTPRPDWALNHPDKCLCEHHIVYHFEIHNTETDVRECVGSDHINSYMILRAIVEETGMKAEAITEDMIQEWIDVRVSALIKDAWWRHNGEDFTKRFNEIKELDLRINVRRSGKYIYDRTLGVSVPETMIRKKGKGNPGTMDYDMASIVWRWNHPDNPKAQIHTKGYPNEKLMTDLDIFHMLIERHKETVRLEDEKLEKDRLHNEEYRKQIALRNSVLREKKEHEFREACEYMDIPVFKPDMGINTWEKRFLTDMESRIIRRRELSERQVSKLIGIVNRYNDKPTERQVNYLRVLGYEGETESLTKGEISELIDRMKEVKE
tara:strand:- start:587 stop:1714 length:1128 start_codon:yes stop_codon:yes gene_type:complete